MGMYIVEVRASQGVEGGELHQDVIGIRLPVEAISAQAALIKASHCLVQAQESRVPMTPKEVIQTLRGGGLSSGENSPFITEQ